MRVTDSSLFELIRRRMQSSHRYFQDAMAPVTTGKKIDSLGDDTLVVNYTLRHDRQEAILEQNEQNLSRQQDRYSVYEMTINNTYDIFVKVKELMVQLANPHTSEDSRLTLRGQLEQYKEHLLGLANTKHEGQYIYSGGRTDVEAYAADGTYQGDSLELEVEILPDIKMPINITGDALFGGVGYPNGENIFQLIDQILVEIDGDPQAVAQSHMDSIDQVLDQIIQEEAKVGVRLSRVEIATSTLESLKMTLAEKRQNIEDVDYMTAITDFKEAEFAFEATKQISGAMFKPTLLNYIR